MKNTTKRKESNLDKEINSVLEILAKVDPGTQEYTTIASNLEKLYNAKSKEKEKGIDLKVIAPIIGNLAGIALILGYERASVITSKALGFVWKGR